MRARGRSVLRPQNVFRDLPPQCTGLVIMSAVPATQGSHTPLGAPALCLAQILTPGAPADLPFKHKGACTTPGMRAGSPAGATAVASSALGRVP